MAILVIGPLDDHKIVLDLRSLICGFGESCTLVECITLQRANMS